jgi:ribonuclease Z
MGLVDTQEAIQSSRPTHIVLLGNEKIPEPPLQDVVAETRQTSDGRLEVGGDLMSFDIGDTITVRRSAK